MITKKNPHFLELYSMLSRKHKIHLRIDVTSLNYQLKKSNWCSNLVSHSFRSAKNLL